MIDLFLLLLAINVVGIIACNRMAKVRGSRHVLFWTTMGIVFGPLPIPFLLWFNPVARHRTGALG
jgi:hypothetical protein